MYALDARHALTSEMKKLRNGLDAAKDSHQMLSPLSEQLYPASFLPLTSAVIQQSS